MVSRSPAARVIPSSPTGVIDMTGIEEWITLLGFTFALMLISNALFIGIFIADLDDSELYTPNLPTQPLLEIIHVALYLYSLAGVYNALATPFFALTPHFHQRRLLSRVCPRRWPGFVLEGLLLSGSRMRREGLCSRHRGQCGRILPQFFLPCRWLACTTATS
jgi:hypothetical protein